jgi:plasmid stabilization system protein ParE
MKPCSAANISRTSRGESGSTDCSSLDGDKSQLGNYRRRNSGTNISADRERQSHRRRETVKAIYDGWAALRDFPHRGRTEGMNGRRELVFSPYIDVYHVKERAVEISQIYHGAQDKP